MEKIALYYRIFLNDTLMGITIVKYLNFMMSFNFLYGITSFSIYNTEMLEKIKAMRDFVRDQDRNLKSTNVLFSRFVFIGVVVLLSLVVTDLRLVYAINGIFLNSFIGLIIPGFLAITRKSELRIMDSAFNMTGDWLCIISGVLALVLSAYDYLSSTG